MNTGKKDDAMESVIPVLAFRILLLAWSKL